ncbi:MAG: AAA family ATPase [Armatimonadota bacterium]|nr:AAA family ATPase [Armatimonadota bacterium]
MDEKRGAPAYPDGERGGQVAQGIHGGEPAVGTCQWESADRAEAVRRFNDFVASLQREVFVPRAVVKQTQYALLCGEHQMLFGPSGTGKSFYATSWFQNITDQQTFRIQLTDDVREEELFGPINVKGYVEAGEYRHLVEAGIIPATFAYLDEFMDAPERIQRSLLSILNERLFIRGGQQEEACLHSAIATSNRLVWNERTEAVLDRFSFKCYMADDPNPSLHLLRQRSFERHRGRTVVLPEARRLPYAVLTELTRTVTAPLPNEEIACPAHVILMRDYAIDGFVEAVNRERAHSRQGSALPFRVSPRIRLKSLNVLRASALLSQRREVAVADLGELRYMIPIVGGVERQEVLFEEQLQGVITQTSARERAQLDELAAIDERMRVLGEELREGRWVELSLLERVCRYLGILSHGQITYKEIARSLARMRPAGAVAERYKASVEEALRQSIDELSVRADTPLCHFTRERR